MNLFKKKEKNLEEEVIKVLKTNLKLNARAQA